MLTIAGGIILAVVLLAIAPPLAAIAVAGTVLYLIVDGFAREPVLSAVLLACLAILAFAMHRDMKENARR